MLLASLSRHLCCLACLERESESGGLLPFFVCYLANEAMPLLRSCKYVLRVYLAAYDRLLADETHFLLLFPSGS